MEDFLKSNINWDLFFQDSHEMIRLDEKLKWKQNNLKSVFHLQSTHPKKRRIFLQKEIIQHQRIIFSMRCFLFYLAEEFLGFRPPFYWKNEIKQSFSMEQYEFFENTHSSTTMDMSSLENHDLWFSLRVMKDKEISKKFFITLIRNTFYFLKIHIDVEIMELMVDKITFRV